MIKHNLKRSRAHKFNAKAVVVDGFRFDSKREADYYRDLNILQQSGEVLCFLRQVPIHLPGNTKYIVDFQVFYTNGIVEFIDVKGVETEMFKLKKRQVEDLYPFEIKIVK